MWHYTEGVHNWDPIWTDHGIRIIPGPSSLWLDATGRRLPAAAVPRLRHARHARAHHGHRPRPHLVRADPEDHREGVRALGLRAEPRHHRPRSQAGAQGRLGSGAPAPVEAFMRHGADFVVERDLPALVRGMNALTPEPLLDHDARRARDRRARPRGREPVREGRPADRDPRRAPLPRRPLTRIAAPHRILDPEAGPLIAVRLSILTRKTLGGLQTDLAGRVLTAERRAAARAVRRGRGRGLRRRRRARLPRARGDLPRRLPVLRPRRRPRGRGRPGQLSPSGATHGSGSYAGPRSDALHGGSRRWPIDSMWR